MITTRTAVVLVLLLALAAHLTYFALDRDHRARDSAAYVQTAESLLAGRGFTRDGVIETRRTPGYPLAIAAFRAAGIGDRGLALAQHLAAALMAAALVLVARRLTGNALIALIAAALVAGDLPTIVHANKILTETAFTLLLLAVFVLAWRIGEGARRPLLEGAIAGLLIGAAALVRPIAVAFFVPLALYFAWTRRRGVIPLFVVCALFLPSMWTVRNYRATGVATLSSISADSMLFFKAAGALAIEDSGDFATNLRRHQAALRMAADDETRRSHSPLDRTRARMGREIVLQHPLAFAKVTARGVAATLLGGGAGRLTLLYTAPALLFAIVGLLYLLKTNTRLGVLVLITLAYFVLLSAGAESYSRFRVPVVPFYSVAIATGVHVALERFRIRNSGS